jgi:homoserine kinase
MKKVSVKSPASVSNITCGYDIFGMALNEPYDIMELSVRSEPGIHIVHNDSFGLSADPEKNIAGVALQAMISAGNIQHGFNIEITKQIKPGSGIGSSAASAAGIVMAANKLLGLDLSNTQLLKFAMEGEVIASGTKHADNLAPCIYGGLTLIRDTATFDIVKLTLPPLFVTILHPQIEIKTSYAREILPVNIPLKDAVKQWANVGGLVAGFLQGDYELIRRSLQDVIVEPVRSKLIPHFDEVKKACLTSGVLGGGISGSGPSVFMLSEKQETAMKAEEAMKDIYDRSGIEYRTYVTTVNHEGVKIT